jgi:hypothetical protein
MASKRANRRLQPVEVNEDGVRAAVIRIDAMTEDELRGWCVTSRRIFVERPK